jgi:hypothetical protein
LAKNQSYNIAAAAAAAAAALISMLSRIIIVLITKSYSVITLNKIK